MIWSAVGLYDAEGSKSPRCFKFTNNEPVLINVFTNYVKREFKVKEFGWRIIGARVGKESTIRYWIGNTELKLENLKSVTMYRNRKVLRKTNIYGTVEVWPIGASHKEMFRKTMFYIMFARVCGVKRIVAEYLKGVFAGDGFIDPKSRFCGIATMNDKKKVIYSTLLRDLGIENKVCKRGVIITGRRNFVKLFSLGIPSLHPRKHKEMISLLARLN